MIYLYLPGIMLDDDHRTPHFPPPIRLGCVYLRTCGMWSITSGQPVFVTVMCSGKNSEAETFERMVYFCMGTEV